MHYIFNRFLGYFVLKNCHICQCVNSALPRCFSWVLLIWEGRQRGNTGRVLERPRKESCNKRHIKRSTVKKIWFPKKIFNIKVSPSYMSNYLVETWTCLDLHTTKNLDWCVDGARSLNNSYHHMVASDWTAYSTSPYSQPKYHLPTSTDTLSTLYFQNQMFANTEAHHKNCTQRHTKCPTPFQDLERRSPLCVSSWKPEACVCLTTIWQGTDCCLTVSTCSFNSPMQTASGHHANFSVWPQQPGGSPSAYQTVECKAPRVIRGSDAKIYRTE